MALVLLLVACASDGPQAAVTPEVLLDRIEALSRATPFTVAGVEATLGATHSSTTDQPYFALYEARAAGGFDKVTVMAPKAGATNGGSVALVLAATPCISAATASPRFGVGHKVPTHPGAPPRPLDVWTHPQPWGDLLLGYDPVTGCLVEATLRSK